MGGAKDPDSVIHAPCSATPNLPPVHGRGQASWSDHRLGTACFGTLVDPGCASCCFNSPATCAGSIYRGYAADYYSYLWAELLAADGFMAFTEPGLVGRATGDRFRSEVLARGATRPAAESFRAFRDRDPEPDAMLIRHRLM